MKGCNGYPFDYDENEKLINDILTNKVEDFDKNSYISTFDEINSEIKLKITNKRKNTRHRILKIACLFIVSIIFSAIMIDWINSDAAMAAKLGFEKFL